MKATLTQKKVPETEPGEARKEAPEAPPEKDLFAKYVFIPDEKQRFAVLVPCRDIPGYHKFGVIDGLGRRHSFAVFQYGISRPDQDVHEAVEIPRSSGWERRRKDREERAANPGGRNPIFMK